MATQLATAAEFDRHVMPSNAFAGVETVTKEAALEWCSGIVLGSVKKRKVLPLLSWGSDLRVATCKLAAYELMSKRGYNPNSGNNDTIRIAYEDTIAWLDKVARGLVELVDCVDSSTTAAIDEAGPLMAGDTIVNWAYQTRGRCRGGGYGDGDGLG